MSANGAALAVVQPQTIELFDDARIALLRKTIANGAPALEFEMFVAVCRRTGLSPEAKQIYFIKRNTRNGPVWNWQTSIDGYRLIAARTGAHAGTDDTIYKTEVGKTKPTTATVTVYRMVGAQRCPFTATARWDEYYPGDQAGQMWLKMPYLMLGKTAEALALRKAFPAELSGLYTDVEMDQAGPLEPTADAAPSAQPGARLANLTTSANGEVIDIETGEITNVATKGEAATTRQLKFIQALGRDLGMTDDLLDAEADRTLRTSVRYLGRAEASTFIEHLNTLKMARDDGSDAQRGTQAEPAASNDKDPRAVAMSRLHAAGAERGLDHDALHRIAAERFGVESLTALVTDDLATLIAWVEREGVVGWQVHGNYLGRIRQARDATDRKTGLELLREVKAELVGAGVSDQDIGEVYRRTLAVVRAMSPAANADSAEGELPGRVELAGTPEWVGVAGNDRFTN